MSRFREMINESKIIIHSLIALSLQLNSLLCSLIDILTSTFMDILDGKNPLNLEDIDLGYTPSIMANSRSGGMKYRLN